MSDHNDPMRPIEGSKKKGPWKPEYSRFRRGGTVAGKGEFNRSLDAKGSLIVGTTGSTGADDSSTSLLVFLKLNPLRTARTVVSDHLNNCCARGEFIGIIVFGARHEGQTVNFDVCRHIE